MRHLSSHHDPAPALLDGPLNPLTGSYHHPALAAIQHSSSSSRSGPLLSDRSRQEVLGLIDGMLTMLETWQTLHVPVRETS
jgi:hypothetical protein